jgi:hypothetical protein
MLSPGKSFCPFFMVGMIIMELVPPTMAPTMTQIKGEPASHSRLALRAKGSRMPLPRITDARKAPRNVAPIMVSGVPFYKCGATGYTAGYAANGVVYMPVPPPPGYRS